MALSQFMPYGAPDLLADQEARMARATFAAMALLGITFSALGLALALLPRSAVREVEIPGYILEPPPHVENIRPPKVIAPPAVTPHAAREGIVVPVPDKIAPPPAIEDVPRPQGTGLEGRGSGEITVAPPQPGEMGGPDPEPTDVIYVDELPDLVRCAPIQYPDFAREAGVEGRVVVLMLVGRDGRVKDARVDPRHTVPMLEAAALESARSCVFKPALVNGHPVAVWVARPYDFRLH